MKRIGSFYIFIKCFLLLGVLICSQIVKGQDFDNLYKKSPQAEKSVIESIVKKYAKSDAEKGAFYIELLTDAFARYWQVDSIQTPFMTDTLTLLKGTYEHLSDSIKRANHAMNDTLSSYQEKENVLNSLLDELKALKEGKSAALQTAYQGREKEHQTNLTQISALEKQHHDNQQRITMVNDSIADFADSIKVLTVRINALQKDLDRIHTATDIIGKKIASLQDYCRSLRTIQESIRNKSLLDGKDDENDLKRVLQEYEAKKVSIQSLLPDVVSETEGIANYLTCFAAIKKIVSLAKEQMGRKFDAKENENLLAKLRKEKKVSFSAKQEEELTALTLALTNQKNAYDHLCQVLKELRKIPCVPSNEDRNELQLYKMVEDRVKSFSKNNSLCYHAYYTKFNDAVKKLIEDLSLDSKFSIKNIETENLWNNYLTSIQNNI